MQAKGVEDQENPKQFIDKVCKVFKSLAVRGKKHRFSLADLRLDNYKLIREDDVMPCDSKSKNSKEGAAQQSLLIEKRRSLKNFIKLQKRSKMMTVLATEYKKQTPAMHT